MATLVTVCFLLMLHMNSSLFLAEEPLYVIQKKGLQALPMITCYYDFAEITVYRLNPDKSRHVFNHTLRTTERNITSELYMEDFYENEDYYYECRQNGQLMEKIRFHVIFCAREEKTERKHFLHGDTADISCQTLNDRETLQVFQTLREWHLKWMSMKILDTSASLELIPDTLRSRSRVEILDDGSLIHFFNASIVDSTVYKCLVWSENQCQSYKLIELDIAIQDIFRGPGESVTLPCVIKNPTPETVLLWLTPIAFSKFGEIEEHAMYEILNGTQTGNYALFIPHLFLNNSGQYLCVTNSEIFNSLNVFVCSSLEPVNMTFSVGDSANLMCAFSQIESLRVQWYREYSQSSKHLLVDTQDAFVNEDMKGRVHINAPNYITISELSLQDGGWYLCRAWGSPTATTGVCFQCRVRLTNKTPGSDTFYIVYASLMGLVLLCMISAVVFVNVMRHKRELDRGDSL